VFYSLTCQLFGLIIVFDVVECMLNVIYFFVNLDSCDYNLVFLMLIFAVISYGFFKVASLSLFVSAVVWLTPHFFLEVT